MIVSDREYTRAGFFTEFEQSEALRIFESGTSMRGGRVGARLNATKIETGYLFYVDDGYLRCVEGYTYGGEDWPTAIDDIEIYDLKIQR